MQTRPDKPTLLDATARFLLEDVAPKLEGDKALQFRVLIAANLASVVASELRTDTDREARELERLKQLTQAEGSHEALTSRLVEAIRAGKAEPTATLNHLLTTARETLEVTNPRFDLTWEA